MSGMSTTRIIRILVLAIPAILSPFLTAEVRGISDEEARARVSRDILAGRPIVAHVVVALCDNEHQGIVPVPGHLGNGGDPGSNLYWGAMYGVRTFFSRQNRWSVLRAEPPADGRILDRAVFYSEIRRGDSTASVYVVADAWDGAEIRGAIESFFAIAGGSAKERVSVLRGDDPLVIRAGGSAHIAAYVGHNGLMEYSDFRPDPGMQREIPGSSIVLACASKPYFLDLLDGIGSDPLLLTTGLMAPEAYTLEAAIRSWAGEGSAETVCDAAAAAYDRYQHCGARAARDLFWCGTR